MTAVDTLRVAAPFYPPPAAERVRTDQLVAGQRVQAPVAGHVVWTVRDDVRPGRHGLAVVWFEELDDWQTADNGSTWLLVTPELEQWWADQETNRAARFVAQASDLTRPTVEVGGARVAVHWDAGYLRVDVDTSGVEPGPLGELAAPVVVHLDGVQYAGRRERRRTARRPDDQLGE